ncbi:MAG: pimeloyl-ACP methyl ester carboxylesterase [Gammaproteobacteria bacterium]|jgi:pimeloyl-ACP methyl ester carboxylesterase
MQVVENQSASVPRMTSFPVVIFRSASAIKKRAPVLHLGAGGPGAPMYLDESWSVESLWTIHNAMSLAQGRDLLIIDPRGAGLSRPLLTCDQFVDSELKRFQQNLSISEEIKSIDDDYEACIEKFISSGIDFSSYNSHAVADDIEALRQADGVDQWVLVGVSYGASYAQAIANKFPDSVESMILDSATMPRIGRHVNYLELTMGPYLKLFQYCAYDPECVQPIKNIEARFWAIHERLNTDPILVQFQTADGADTIPVVLNGERFLSAVLQGIYGVEIFKDLPHIISELETGKFTSLEPYLWLHVDYMLDRSYGDVSAIAHYCFEEKPFIDFEKIKPQIDNLPVGYIQDTARLALGWTDYCEDMQLKNTASKPIPSNPIATPTLFLHGRFDTVTPLSSIVAGQDFFENSQLLTFDLSHSVLTSSKCAVAEAARFIQDPLVFNNRANCE